MEYSELDANGREIVNAFYGWMAVATELVGEDELSRLVGERRRQGAFKTPEGADNALSEVYAALPEALHPYAKDAVIFREIAVANGSPGPSDPKYIAAHRKAQRAMSGSRSVPLEDLSDLYAGMFSAEERADPTPEEQTPAPESQTQFTEQEPKDRSVTARHREIMGDVPVASAEERALYQDVQTYKRQRRIGKEYDTLFKLARMVDPSVQYGYEPARIPEQLSKEDVAARRSSLQEEISSLVREKERSRREAEAGRLSQQESADNLARAMMAKETKSREIALDKDKARLDSIDKNVDDANKELADIEAGMGRDELGKAEKTAIKEGSDAVRAQDPSTADKGALAALKKLEGNPTAKFWFFYDIGQQANPASGWTRDKATYIDAIRPYAAYIDPNNWEAEAGAAFDHMEVESKKRRDAAAKLKIAEEERDDFLLVEMGGLSKADVAQYRVSKKYTLGRLSGEEEAGDIEVGFGRAAGDNIQAPPIERTADARGYVESVVPGAQLARGSVILPGGSTMDYAEFARRFPSAKVGADGGIVPAEEVPLTDIDLALKELRDDMQRLDDPAQAMSVLQRRKQSIVSQPFFLEFMDSQGLTDVDFAFEAFLRDFAGAKRDTIMTNRQTRDAAVLTGAGSAANAPATEKAAALARTTFGPIGKARRKARRRDIKDWATTLGDKKQDSDPTETAAAEAPPGETSPAATAPVKRTRTVTETQQPDKWTSGEYTATLKEDGSLDIYNHSTKLTTNYTDLDHKYAKAMIKARPPAVEIEKEVEVAVPEVSQEAARRYAAILGEAEAPDLKPGRFSRITREQALAKSLQEQAGEYLVDPGIDPWTAAEIAEADPDKAVEATGAFEKARTKAAKKYARSLLREEKKKMRKAE